MSNTRIKDVATIKTLRLISRTVLFAVLLPVFAGCSLSPKALRPSFSYTKSASKSSSPVETLTLSPDQKYLVQGQHITSKEDEKVRGDVLQIWDVTERSPSLLFQTRGGANLAATFTSDGKYLMACRNTGVARIRLSDKSTQVVTLNQPKILSPLGDYVACATEEGWVIRHTDDPAFNSALPKSVDRFLAFSSDKNLIATSLKKSENSETGKTKIAIWNFDHEKLAMQSEFMIQQYASPEKSCFSSDGQLFATIIKQGSVGIWEASTGKLVQQLDEHGGTIRTITFSPNGSLLAVGTQGAKEKHGKLYIWDARDGKLTREFDESHAEGVTAVCFTENGDTVFVGDTDGNVRRHRIKKSG